VDTTLSAVRPPDEAPLKVSLVVPTHNTGETVLTGLRSFYAQTMPHSDFEVIYVDDGSTDDTVAIVEAEAARTSDGPAVRVLRIENSGWPGRPRNVGMAAARGEFVHFVDDDDWLAPEALERVHARAEETGADIVAGRMAGHGRRAPRAVFAKPIASWDIRSDKERKMLGTMTVHKLFRRSFLEKHAMRFEEGRVRLEDHMFMLRAYLLTDRIATVHDYTCYHWVKHSGEGKQHISYGVPPGPYVESVRKVLAILDAPDTRIEKDAHRYSLASRWYGNKALERLTGKLFLDQSEERRIAWFDAVSGLASDMPPAADAALPARLRIAAALARHGDRRLTEEHARFEAALTHQPRVEGTEWQDGKLTARCSTRLVRRPKKRAPAVPAVFDLSRTEGRYELELPPEVAAVPGVRQAADFTRQVKRSNVTAVLRHREGSTELDVPATCHMVEVPIREDLAGGRVAGRLPGWVKSRIPAARRAARKCSLRYDVEITLDPASADQGRPLAPGTWEVRLRLNCGGWRLVRTLPELTVEGPPAPEKEKGESRPKTKAEAEAEAKSKTKTKTRAKAA
jgi:poly(ribitol-phosphate) beta-N-acetylglucosaminyltransferase